MCGCQRGPFQCVLQHPVLLDVVRRHASGGRLRADCNSHADSHAWPDTAAVLSADASTDTYAYFAADACAQRAPNTTNAPADACTDNASADAIL